MSQAYFLHYTLCSSTQRHQTHSPNVTVQISWIHNKGNKPSVTTPVLALLTIRMLCDEQRDQGIKVRRWPQWCSVNFLSRYKLPARLTSQSLSLQDLALAQYSFSDQLINEFWRCWVLAFFSCCSGTYPLLWRTGLLIVGASLVVVPRL